MAVIPLSEEIVDTILRDLMDRRSIKVPFIELEDQDPEMFEEMKRDLISDVDEVLGSLES